MGSWFSNMQIRRSERATDTAVIEYIKSRLMAQQYLPAESEEDADGGVAILRSEGWISLYSDLLLLENPKTLTELASQMSAELHTDVLGISCFDSDYLFLNLINADEKTNAWLGIGSASGLGLKRRTGLTAWKNKVTDFAAFSKAAKEDYVFAEEFLGAAEGCLGLPKEHSGTCYEYLLEMDLTQQASYFYFKLPEEMKCKEPTKLRPYMYTLTPCFLDRCGVVDAINIGGESRGLSVYFLGPYVEHEEITFSDVCFVKYKGNSSQEMIPIFLSKVPLTDGQWAYYYHDPGYRIPPKVDDRLRGEKRQRTEFERRIVVRFVPHGNPRKVLDITVVLVPDKNPEGQTAWNVWHYFGSKKAFFEHYYATRGPHLGPGAPPPIKEEDFD